MAEGVDWWCHFVMGVDDGVVVLARRIVVRGDVYRDDGH